MYSVRMRASQDERHVSGAERIVEEDEIQETLLSLVERAQSHERGKPDFINISIEDLKKSIKHLTSLPLTLLDVENAASGKNTAKRLLSYLGIPLFCIDKAFSLLENGACNGESMRGAMVMNLEGKRLEPDKQRGIRATHMDITEDASCELRRLLDSAGLSSKYTPISEALVLATKVASVDGTIAELCWSDDPFYTAGYVASKNMGYVRIPHMKDEGDCRGGRVFFVDGIDLNKYIHEMEKSPVLVNRIGGIRNMPDFIHNLQEDI